MPELLQAVAERLDPDAFGELPPPDAINLRLQVTPDAGVDRQDPHLVPDPQGRRVGDR
jgi:hypothetical protein